MPASLNTLTVPARFALNVELLLGDVAVNVLPGGDRYTGPYPAAAPHDSDEQYENAEAWTLCVQALLAWEIQRAFPYFTQAFRDPSTGATLVESVGFQWTVDLFVGDGTVDMTLPDPVVVNGVVVEPVNLPDENLAKRNKMIEFSWKVFDSSLSDLATDAFYGSEPGQQRTDAVNGALAVIAFNMLPGLGLPVTAGPQRAPLLAAFGRGLDAELIRLLCAAEIGYAEARQMIQSGPVDREALRVLTGLRT